MIRCTPVYEGMYGEEEWTWESLSLLFILAVRRMRRKHIRTMSKNADDACSLEGVSTFHPCFIDIFTVCFLKRPSDRITRRFCPSSVVSSAHLVARFAIEHHLSSHPLHTFYLQITIIVSIIILTNKNLSSILIVASSLVYPHLL